MGIWLRDWKEGLLVQYYKSSDDSSPNPSKIYKRITRTYFSQTEKTCLLSGKTSWMIPSVNEKYDNKNTTDSITDYPTTEENRKELQILDSRLQHTSDSTNSWKRHVSSCSTYVGYWQSSPLLSQLYSLYRKGLHNEFLVVCVLSQSCI